MSAVQGIPLVTNAHDDKGAVFEPDGMRLHVYVVFTSPEETAAALRRAAELAQRLDGRVQMVVLQPVPFPAPLNAPPVAVDWNEARLRAVAEASALPIRVHVYLCRNRAATLLRALPPESLVVLAGRGSGLWPTFGRRLARRLDRAGHTVVFVETK